MKKIFIIAIISLIFAQAQAQETIGDKYHDKRGRPIRFNVIKTNLMGIGLGMYNIGYERRLNKRYSLMLDMTVFGNVATSPFKRGDDNFAIATSGFAISPEIRWYLGRHGGPRGYYLGIYLPYIKYDAQIDRSSIINTEQLGENVRIPVQGQYSPHATYFGIGLSGGPQFVIANRVTLELYLNISIGVYSYKNVGWVAEGKSSNVVNSFLPNGNYTVEQLASAGISVEDSDSYRYSLANSGGNQVLVTNYQKEEKIENQTGIIPIPRFGFVLGYAFGK